MTKVIHYANSRIAKITPRGIRDGQLLFKQYLYTTCHAECLYIYRGESRNNGNRSRDIPALLLRELPKGKYGRWRVRCRLDSDKTRPDAVHIMVFIYSWNTRPVLEKSASSIFPCSTLLSTPPGWRSRRAVANCICCFI